MNVVDKEHRRDQTGRGLSRAGRNHAPGCDRPGCLDDRFRVCGVRHPQTQGDEHTYAAWSLALSLLQLRPWIEEVAGSGELWTP